MDKIQHFRKISLKSAILLICPLVALGLFAEIVQEVLREKEGNFDNAVFDFMSQFTTPALTKIMIVISLLGSSYFMLPAYILLIIFLLIKKETLTAFYTGLIGVSSGLIIFGLKSLFHRSRPENSLDGKSLTYSFPSGHTTSAFIFYGMLICLIWNTNWKKEYKYILSFLLGLIALLVAFSRVYLHKHFASDVVGGLCVGTMWLSIIIGGIKKLKVD